MEKDGLPLFRAATPIGPKFDFYGSVLGQLLLEIRSADIDEVIPSDELKYLSFADDDVCILWSISRRSLTRQNVGLH